MNKMGNFFFIWILSNYITTYNKELKINKKFSFPFFFINFNWTHVSFVDRMCTIFRWNIDILKIFVDLFSIENFVWVLFLFSRVHNVYTDFCDTHTNFFVFVKFNASLLPACLVVLMLYGNVNVKNKCMTKK